MCLLRVVYQWFNILVKLGVAFTSRFPSQRPNQRPALQPLFPAYRRRSQAAQPSQRRVVEDENSVMVKGITYTKLECVGRGGSSKVSGTRGEGIAWWLVPACLV